MITDSVKVPESEVDIFKYNIDEGIIGWMDCGGSNLVKINQQFLESTGSGIVRIIFTTRGPDHPECFAREKAKEIGKANGIGKLPLVEFDFNKYEKEHGVEKGDYFKALKLVELNSQMYMISKKLYGTEKEKTKSKLDMKILKIEIGKLNIDIKSDIPINKIIQVRDDACRYSLEKIYKRMESKK